MSEHDHSRVQPAGPDDESLRAFGRQLAMDALLASLGPKEPVVAPPARRSLRSRVVALVVAAAVLLGVGVTTLLWNRTPKPIGDVPTPIDPMLAAGWRVIPTGDAVYRVVAADSVQLERGELFVEAVAVAEGANRPALIIQTPDGSANTLGTQCYIGTYPIEADPKQGSNMRHFTRVLVLAGMVTFTNPHGTITGQPNQLLAAEPDKAPVNHAVQANSGFALDLYKRLARENEGKNLFFSPYSIATALAMTMEGARGETAEQMGNVLRFPAAARPMGPGNDLLPWNTALIHTGMKNLHERFNPKPPSPELLAKLSALQKEYAALQEKPKKKLADFKAELAAAQRLSELAAQINSYELRTANALWAEKTYPFAKSYMDTLNKFYGTGAANPVDFVNSPEAVRQRINTWVEEQTNKRIKDLLPEGSVSQNTALVLANAIYFKGDWAMPFDPKKTKEEIFHTATGKAKVPMMRQYDYQGARYAGFNADGSVFIPTKENRDKDRFTPKGGFVVVELPYKGKEVSMVLLVPTAETGLTDLENAITHENLNTWMSKLEERKIDLHLPRFQLDTTYDLKKTLTAMGMTRAFNPPKGPNGAQFDGMSASGDLYISGAFHKAFVAVDEKGTEAAAATGIVVGTLSAPPAIPTVRADRPFLFLIRDVKTNSILFLGRITQPTK